MPTTPQIVILEDHATITATARTGTVHIALIDLADVARCSEWNWRVYDSGKGGFYWRGTSKVSGGFMYLHRFITDAPAGMWVDHINHDLDDNRRSNLRVLTPAQSGQNIRPYRDAVTGHQNVYMSRRGTRYRVRMMVNGKMINFGTYPTLDEAIKVAAESRLIHQPYRHETAIRGGAV